jgi:undecaprenyl phosphate N,N'-diacetylbacillosamine 1-phosphate transferase
MKNTLYSKFFKRFVDFNLAFIAVILLAIPFALILIFQFLFNGLPLFFVQPRVGKDEKVFHIIKLRTMKVKVNKNDEILQDFNRITPFGSFLRKSSIDELPSLINVLKGDMALVGPRPLLIEYLPLYSKEQRKRHLIRPGLSGLAQIRGRNSLTWKQKFYFDVEYINKMSLLFDFKIIFFTILNVFFSKNINQSNITTMQKFNGKN